MFEEILRYLALPTSHALSLSLGAWAVYKFVVRPERKRNDRLEDELNEVFRAHREALNRVQQGPR